MATGSYGRRLSELLQEQQEPFLLLIHGRGSRSSTSQKAADAGRRSVLGGALRRALRRWDVTGAAVAACFLPCGGAAGGLDRFRQLRRAAHDDDDDCGARRLSPVSVLDVLHADADADEDSSWEEEEEERPSTSSDLDLAGFTSFYTAAANIRATEPPQHKAEKTMPPPPTTSGNKSTMDEKDEEQRTVISSSWESVAAADIARIPLLLELDLSGGLARERRRRRLADEEAEQKEAWRVVASIEAMIFEEMRGDAVRDMID